MSQQMRPPCDDVLPLSSVNKVARGADVAKMRQEGISELGSDEGEEGGRGRCFQGCYERCNKCKQEGEDGEMGMESQLLWQDLQRRGWVI